VLGVGERVGDQTSGVVEFEGDKVSVHVGFEGGGSDEVVETETGWVRGKKGKKGKSQLASFVDRFEKLERANL